MGDNFVGAEEIEQMVFKSSGETDSVVKLGR